MRNCAYDKLKAFNERILYDHRMRTDHNEDNTNEIIHTWLATSARNYHHVDFEVIGNETRREKESTPTHWPEERHLDIIKYKEEAMRYAKQIWADFVFVSIIFLYKT